jgi:hypothetical protein
VETYIVRIYRREPGDPDHIAGTLEIPGCSEMQPFLNIEELLNIFRKGSLGWQREKLRKRTEKITE